MVLAILFCLGDPETVLVSFSSLAPKRLDLTARTDVTHRLPFHSSLLRRSQIQSRRDGHGFHRSSPDLVCGHRVPRHRIAHDLVICPRPGSSLSSIHKQGMIENPEFPGPTTTTDTSSQVEPRASIPVIAIALVTIIPALLALIYIGSSTVFEDVVSLSTSGLYASYFIPCALLLWRRTTGQVRPHTGYAPDDSETIPDMLSAFAMSDPTGEVSEPQLAWGPWHLPGIFGVINNIYACIYIVFVLFWSFWPPLMPVTAQNMNYSVLMTFAAIAFSIVYYYIWGKKQYKGPLVERDAGTSVVVVKQDPVKEDGKVP